ncbi:Pesticin receptor [Sinobacterium norvegicum]|uniref:Pesticin receptor n=1 Tax=Sinobacterium norvegicum TaxID=1641715 RepID=A0ABN8EF12_9GAMM|nr:TonB-dependent receptor [Sinobacterium norvegicum]CAH0990574.1 Pesticin receptor [Sinobacterium norvegicum]
MLPFFTRKPLAAVIAMASVGLTSAAMAQNNTPALEEVVVTAEKREASLQDTPISIAAFDQTELDKYRIENIGDLEGMTPNLSITPFPTSRSSLVVFIRGIGNNDSQTTQDPAVGIYMDGVYVGRSTGLTTDVAALERIEILRGPQGTLYGRNTTGGAINYVTTKPTQEFGFQQKVSGGNNDYWQSVTTVDSGEVIDGLTSKLTFLKSHNGGWVENTGSGNDFGEEEKTAGRVAISFAPTEELSFDYGYDYSENTGPQQFYQTTWSSVGPYQAKRQDKGAWAEDVEDSNTKVYGHSLTASYDLGAAVIKSITAYRNLDESIIQDYSGQSFAPGFRVNIDVNHEQWSQEFQLLGDIGDNINYVTGLYYYKEKALEQEYDTAPLPPTYAVGVVENRYIQSRNEALAAYGQMTYSFNEMIDLTAGLRYTEDKREASKDSINFTQQHSGSETYSNINPSLTLNVHWMDDVSTYAKVVNGYKSGGFNARSTEEGFQKPFDEEELWSYELGLKSMLLDDRVRLNAAVFYNDYSNMQIQQITDNTKIFLTDVFNAGEATTQGIELDVTAMIIEGLSVTANYAYLDAEFDKVSDGQSGADVTSSYTMPYAPENSYNISLDHTLAIGDMTLASSLNYNWRDVQFGTAANPDMEGFKIDSYGLLNGRVQLSGVKIAGDSELEFGLWGKNLADEEYIVHTISQGVMHNGYFGEPLSYGLDVTFNY